MALDALDQLGVVWRPDPLTFGEAPLGRMASRFGLRDVESVYRRAADDPNWYWEAAAEDVGLRWMHPYDAVVDVSEGIEFARYFPGGRLNWSDFAVDRWVDNGHGDALAIRWEGDGGEQRQFTYLELRTEIAQAAGALAAAGVGIGDTVGVLLPMVPEAVVAMLAIARLGAIAVPMFSGYAPAAIRERLERSGAKVVVVADEFPRRGRPVPVKAHLDEAITGLAIDRVLVVRRTGVTGSFDAGRDRWWDDELGRAEPVLDAVPMASDDACLLLFTSGSTGRPKGCVHTHGGLPFKLAAEARHAMGVDERSTLMWITDMGWVMGSFVIAAALGNGATAAMFEGTPDWPDPDRLWSVAERLDVTVLGMAPTVVRSLMRHDAGFADRHDLAKLAVIGSTGEPWNVESWLWCYQHVGKQRTPIVNLSGGTECGGSLLSGSIHLGAKPMSFSGPTLGIAADVVDETGQPVRSQLGELVVRQPWPGMTRGLWHDRDGYLETYWRRFPGAWRQGDLAYADPDGYWFILGRSDDTMNIAGKRVGPAEVESAMMSDPDVVEAAAIGVPHDIKGEALVVLVVLRDGVEFDQVRQRLHAHARRQLGPTMVPEQLYSVAELPKTRNGKVLRRLVRSVYLGEPLGDLTSLENAATLTELPRRDAG